MQPSVSLNIWYATIKSIVYINIQCAIPVLKCSLHNIACICSLRCDTVVSVCWYPQTVHWPMTLLSHYTTNTRSLGALRAPTSSLWPFGPPFGPSGLLNFVLRALRALRPCDPRTVASGTDVSHMDAFVVFFVFVVFFCIFRIFFWIFFPIFYRGDTLEKE